ncbi:hypothetical protein HORIV_19320 [Vreelandella olivaria]|uniref:Uncharacterized protein n=1 Tax=Vreelandella olivaria TaxID=390919 RepID=A0ABM7GG03_9GAMM|nr:hypothetical protein HORIV_19320 [Halomonas olivaria]
MATVINGMKLKNMLGKINTHNANVVHGWILFQDAVSVLRTLDEVLLHLGTEGRIHPISHNGHRYPFTLSGWQPE